MRRKLDKAMADRKKLEDDTLEIVTRLKDLQKAGRARALSCCGGSPAATRHGEHRQEGAV